MRRSWSCAPTARLCDAEEHGELVQRGSLVALGYWNDPAKTAERFKPTPGQRHGAAASRRWRSGPGIPSRRTRTGFLYFVGRKDEMIKTSGYRVSPTEVEEIVYASGLVGDAVAIGVPHPKIEKAIVVVASPAVAASAGASSIDGCAQTVAQQLLDFCRTRMPTFMVPHRIEWLEELPRNPNGKIRPTHARSTVSRLAEGCVVT